MRTTVEECPVVLEYYCLRKGAKCFEYDGVVVSIDDCDESLFLDILKLYDNIPSKLIEEFKAGKYQPTVRIYKSVKAAEYFFLLHTRAEKISTASDRHAKALSEGHINLRDYHTLQAALLN